MAEESRFRNGTLDKTDHESDSSDQDHEKHEDSRNANDNEHDPDNDVEKNARKGEEPEPYDWPEDDPEHPHNWNVWLKLYIGILLTLITIIVSINSSIYDTASAQTMPYFGISQEVNTLGTTLFLVGFMVGPPFWGPLSESSGRRIPIITGLACSGIFTIMGAEAKNAATILLARFFSGAFGAAPISIVGGAATDNWNSIDRAVALASVIGAVFSGPMLGPIIGDFISANTSWRWNMWVCVIASLALSVLAFFTMPETYAPVLLARKTERLRKEMGDNNIKCARDMTPLSLNTVVRVYLFRPWQMLALEPILVCITLYMSFIYGLLYLFFSAFPIVFHEDRGWALGASGLPIFSPLIGVLVGTVIVVTFTKTKFARLVREADGKLVAPEKRLPLMIAGGALLPAGLFWFAWTSNPTIPWPAPCAGAIVAGCGMFLIWIQCFTYIIDVYLAVANSALASNGVVRSSFGAGFPLFATQMYHNLGSAWASSTLAFLALAMFPIPVLFYIYGEKIRSYSKFTAKAH